MPGPSHLPFCRTLFLSMLAVVLLAAPALHAQTQPPAPTTRSISGRVTDGDHEPLRGAIVKLQSPDSNAIITYITTADGGYHFKRIDGSADFRIWASYRGHSSPVHFISKFDSHLQTVINFKIRPY